MPSPPRLPDHVVSIDIQVPRERVWDEITKTGRVQLAVMNTVLEGKLVPGAKLRYYSPNHKRVFVVGEVVEVMRPVRFSHTYMFTFRPEALSLVTWELEEIPGGCRVKLTHSGWTDQVKTHKGVVGGWVEILKLLKLLLETGDIPFSKKIAYRVQGGLMFMLPWSTKTEHVARTGW